MRQRKQIFSLSILVGISGIGLVANPVWAFAAETAEASVNGTLVMPASNLAIFYDSTGVSVAGAAAFHEPKADYRVSRLPRPASNDPQLPADDGNKPANAQESQLIRAVLYDLAAWPAASTSTQQNRNLLQQKIKNDIAQIKPIPAIDQFTEVSKEVIDTSGKYMPLVAITDEQSNTGPPPPPATPSFTESAKASATQSVKISGEPEDEKKSFDTKTNPSTQVKDNNLKDQVIPLATAFAKSLDPVAVEWQSQGIRELSIDLAGLTLSATTSTMGARALAFSFMDLILVDGTDDVGSASDEIGDTNPFARRLFSLDLWLISNDGGISALDVFDLIFDSSITAIKDNNGNNGATAVRNALYDYLVSSDYNILSPYLLTLTFEAMEGADPLKSVMFVQNYSGGVAGFVPEPTTVALMALGLPALGAVRRKKLAA